jgi:hypothetical protein
VIRAWERDDLAAFLRRSERLVGDDIAPFLLRCRSIMEPVSAEASEHVHATGKVALTIAEKLGQIAAAVENARCDG